MGTNVEVAPPPQPQVPVQYMQLQFPHQQHQQQLQQQFPQHNQQQHQQHILKQQQQQFGSPAQPLSSLPPSPPSNPPSQPSSLVGTSSFPTPHAKSFKLLEAGATGLGGRRVEGEHPNEHEKTEGHRSHGRHQVQPVLKLDSSQRNISKLFFLNY